MSEKRCCATLWSLAITWPLSTASCPAFVQLLRQWQHDSQRRTRWEERHGRSTGPSIRTHATTALSPHTTADRQRATRSTSTESFRRIACSTRRRHTDRRSRNRLHRYQTSDSDTSSGWRVALASRGDRLRSAQQAAAGTLASPVTFTGDGLYDALTSYGLAVSIERLHRDGCIGDYSRPTLSDILNMDREVMIDGSGLPIPSPLQPIL